MLKALRIQNVALIEDVQLDLGPGLVILTGETGAGKSILLDGIQIGLGGRVSRELILGGEKPSQVDLLFTELNDKTNGLCETLGIDTEDDELLLTRRFMPGGRGTVRINGQMASAGTLKEIAATLLDIHGQSEHQSLLHPAAQREILDRSDVKIAPVLKAYQEDYETYRTLEDTLKKYLSDEKDRARLLALMEFEKDEIEQAGLQEGEEEALRTERSRLYHMEHLKQGIAEALESLRGDTMNGSASGLLEDAIASLSRVADYDAVTLNPVMESLNDAAALLDDMGRELYEYQEDLTYDPERLNEIEERLALISKLKDKYGNSVADIQAYLEDLKLRYEKLKHIEETKEDLQRDLAGVRRQMSEHAKTLHSLRTRAADMFSKHITEELETLEFQDPVFHVKLEPLETYGPYGTDSILFLIRTNVGTSEGPLTKIASGGELSRIMLAIKTEMAGKDEIPTMIFDEIDTGISGRTAQRVAEKMAKLAGKHQILAVTHLPQIAAMADQHFSIEKHSDGISTRTFIHALDHAGMVDELVRLSGGLKVTDASVQHAAEMKEQAEQYKKALRGETP